jgi:hypothetical protein
MRKCVEPVTPKTESELISVIQKRRTGIWFPCHTFKLSLDNAGAYD